MESLNSFKGYGKVDPVEDSAFHRTTRRRLLVIFVSVILLLFLIIGVSVFLFLRHDNGNTPSSPTTNSSNDAIKTLCALTLHPKKCMSTLHSSNSSHPEDLFHLSLHVALSSLSGLSDRLSKWADANGSDARVKDALDVCEESIRDSSDLLDASTSIIRHHHHKNVLNDSAAVADLRTYLSAVLTNLDTCLDGFDGKLRRKVEATLGNSTELTSNSLAIVTHMSELFKQLEMTAHRKLLATSVEKEKGDEDHWWVARGRAMLQEDGGEEKVDVMVAQDGSGDVRTIGEALSKVPKKSRRVFVIKVKAGKYHELVKVEKHMWNVIMIGDGRGKTIITGDRNAADGVQTYRTATFVVEGRGFTARGITVENTAGPKGKQAVAARVKADRAAFFQCSFKAYQDTLYAHSFRQFYRECDIVGTVDFIFGDASAVFQKCRIMPRQPDPRQHNILTAQGKTDKNQNTGFSIQFSTVAPYGRVDAPTFLGRPWKPYSTVVYMSSEIDRVVDPKGWASWNGKSGMPSTTMYGEYANSGSGAATAKRLRWEGYEEPLSAAKVRSFSVGTFIQGASWLADSHVPFRLNV